MKNKYYGMVYGSLTLLLSVFATLGHTSDPEVSGSVGFEPRLFLDDPLYSGQEDNTYSLAFDPEFHAGWDNGNQSFVAHPFFRYDSADDERTHADLREFYWSFTGGDWTLIAGVAKVFWGVTESQHLVDIINQTDLVEDIDTEDKLGQPMVHLNLNRDIGTFDFFVLPYFRERTFPGEEGRLRPGLVVDTDNPVYQSNDKEHHIDFAVRWSNTIGDWDIGLAHFSGTSREPLLIPTFSSGGPVLTPFYPQIDQTSLDLQATKGAWLWKLEGIYNDNDYDNYFAYVGGFEYTWGSAFESDTDLGLLLEYHFDDRDELSTTGFQNDLFAGLRWVLNDVAGTEILAGSTFDLDDDTVFSTIEASKRLGNAWKLGLEVRLFTNVDRDNLFYVVRQDDYVEIQLTRYF